jgi:hopanoid biosynthesis associated protein HpnK
VKRLIINADDFGMTAGINRGIAHASREGLVRSSTLMASGAAFDDAVRTVKGMDLDVGCHVVLVGGSPLLDGAEVRSLASSNGNVPARFRSSIVALGVAALRGKLNTAELYREIAAQIHKLQTAGLTLSHVDTHKHAHIFPAVLRPLLEAARDSGIRAVRSPFAPFRVLAAQLLGPRDWRRGGQVALLRAFHRDFQRELQRTGVRAPDGAFGIVATGSLNSATFEAIAAAIPEGTWELVCHPGYVDAELDRVATRLRRSRETELDLLCSPQARGALERHQVDVISYRDFLGS